MQVTISLKNPPNGANRWGLSLYDWADEEKFLSETVTSVEGVATFDIPTDWTWPLRFFISIMNYRGPGDYDIVYEAQSISTDYPDYVEEFIPEGGDYYYNVPTEKLARLQAGCLPMVILLLAIGGLAVFGLQLL